MIKERKKESGWLKPILVESRINKWKLGMKFPLTALLLAEELIPDTESGAKFVTIREGHRDYRPGKVIFACPEVAWSMAKEITEVKHTTPRKCSTKDYKDEGWVSRKNMVEDLQRFYPNLNMDSPITVIRFK